MIAIFVYNILLIILYSITMTFAIYAYLKEKKKLISLDQFVFGILHF